MISGTVSELSGNSPVRYWLYSYGLRWTFRLSTWIWTYFRISL